MGVLHSYCNRSAPGHPCHSLNRKRAEALNRPSRRHPASLRCCELSIRRSPRRRFRRRHCRNTPHQLSASSHAPARAALQSCSALSQQLHTQRPQPRRGTLLNRRPRALPRPASLQSSLHPFKTAVPLPRLQPHLRRPGSRSQPPGEARRRLSVSRASMGLRVTRHRRCRHKPGDLHHSSAVRKLRQTSTRHSASLRIPLQPTFLLIARKESPHC
jgi:hypothetical protein